MLVEDIVRINMDDGIPDLLDLLEKSMDGCRNLDYMGFSDVLRQASLISSIDSSVAIEGNRLGPSAVAEIYGGEQVQGPFDEIVEVDNAIKAYGRMSEWDAWSVDDFLDAFDILMFGLVEEPGFRRCGVGVFEGESIIYRAPSHEQVPSMIERLFQWGSESRLPEPVVGAAVHFYIESIHPFVDGNGRMGRLWNSKILSDSDTLFSLVPMETYIRRRQDDYYRVLEECQSTEGFDCTPFVKFCLKCLVDAFGDLSHLSDGNIMALMEAMGDDTLSLKEIMERMGFGSRDKFMRNYMGPALDFGIVSRTEPKGNSRYQMYRRIV